MGIEPGCHARSHSVVVQFLHALKGIAGFGTVDGDGTILVHRLGSESPQPGVDPVIPVSHGMAHCKAHGMAHALKLLADFDEVLDLCGERVVARLIDPTLSVHDLLAGSAHGHGDPSPVLHRVFKAYVLPTSVLLPEVFTYI